MTPEQILLVQASFDMAGGDGAAVARCLRTRLAARGADPGIPSARLARYLARNVRGASRPTVLAASVRRIVRRLGAPPPALRDRAALVDAVGDALGAPLPTAAAEAWRAWHGVVLGSALVSEVAQRQVA